MRLDIRKCSVPLEEEEVQVVEVLGEEVAQDAVRVAALDLVGRETEVDALYKVPQLSHWVPVEPPETTTEKIYSVINNRFLICVRVYTKT